MRRIKKNARTLVKLGALVAVLPAIAFGKDMIRIAPKEADADGAQKVGIVDARPEWQKKRKLLSVWRPSCDFAILRMGDDDTTPARAAVAAYGLARHLPAELQDKEVKLTWFTVHKNNQAPRGTTPNEEGLVYDALHAL